MKTAATDITKLWREIADHAESNLNKFDLVFKETEELALKDTQLSNDIAQLKEQIEAQQSS